MKKTINGTILLNLLERICKSFIVLFDISYSILITNFRKYTTSFYSNFFIFFIFLLVSGVLYSQTDTLFASGGFVIPKPYLWYRADNTLNGVGFAHDFSGHNNIGFSESGFAISDSGVINFNKAFKFSQAGSDFRTNNMPIKNSRLNIFTVYKISDIDSDEFLWTIYFDTANIASLTSKRLKTFMMDKVYDNSLNIHALLNSSSVGWLEMWVDSGAYISLGNRDSSSFIGDIGDFMLFNCMLDSVQQMKIQSYLAIKYGITLIESDYCDAEGHILWDYKGNETFNNEIGGIGRDSVFSLYQKQSCADGGENILTIAIDSILPTNEQNQSFISQGDYLVWGSNNKKTSDLCDSLNDYEVGNLSAKRWLMQVTGDSMRSSPTQMLIDLVDIEYPEKSILIIDRSGENTFTISNIDVYYPDSAIFENRVRFSNILWDTDLSGKDVFSFIVGDKLTLLAEGSTNNISGKISMNILGGTAPFNYKITHTETNQVWQWNSDLRNQTQDQLPFGEYMISVIDHDRKKDTIFVFILSEKSNRATTQAIDTATILNNNIISGAEVYPNPSNSDFTILVRLLEKKKIKIDISDITGKIIKTIRKPSADNFEIHESLTVSGVYYINIQAGFEKMILPIFIQK